MKYYVVISLVAVLGIGAGLYAYSGSATNVFEGDCVNCNLTAPEIPIVENQENLGATAGGDFYTPVTFHDELITNGTVNIPLNWAQATSTGIGTQLLILGKYHYTGIDDVVCSGAGNGSFIYIDGLVPYTASYRLGTTTCATATSRTCGDGTTSFTATTSQGIITKVQVNTSTATAILNADDNEGDYARESFKLQTNDWVLVTLDFSTSPFSTSTMPTLASQGLTATGAAKISCKKAE